ncbi:MAG: sensor histidine kinase [Bacteroidetes bacterium]|nr:sensor histidine kinase [Bacteroidota bacterium]
MEEAKNLNFISALLPAVTVVFIIAVGVVLLTQQFRKNLYRQRLEKEELKNQHQTELLRSSIEVQEEERKRIARDMHDELGATLSITRMHLLQAERQLGDKDPKLLAELQNIRSLTETSLNNMRQISHQLMPPQLEAFGLLKTLETLTEQLSKASDIRFELNIPQSSSELSWPVKLGLYRIFMELINNTIKHSGAQKISIELSYQANTVIARYSDDGRGLVEGTDQDGLGHKSMEGRASSLGGSMTWGNNPLGGYHAIIQIPLAG